MSLEKGCVPRINEVRPEEFLNLFCPLTFWYEDISAETTLPLFSHLGAACICD